MPDLSASSTRSLINRLGAVSTVFSGAAAEKVALLNTLEARPIQAPHLLKRLHALLCYLLAFPDDPAVWRASQTGLARFSTRIALLKRRQADALADSGIAGTPVHYEYSYESAVWLTARFPGDVEIDWDNFETPERLDDMLLNFINHAEQETFDEGALETREWIDLAKGDAPLTDLSWLLRQCQGGGVPQTMWAQLFHAAEVPMIWDLGGGIGSKTHNRYRLARESYRSRGMRVPGEDPVKEIAKPLRTIEHLDARRAKRLLDVIQAGLLARNREVYSMQYANPREVYVASVGRGVQIALLGVLPRWRFSLEINYGHMILSNGVPIGYGGVTPLFHQANTGINIFEEYRRSEAAFLYSQVLRLGHTLFGVTRFVVNPYQFGADNREALDSGAFWFYYRLGFRPVERKVARLAEREFSKVRARRRYRTPIAALKELASGDLHLELTGADQSQYFDERWLPLLAQGATRRIAALTDHNRRRAINHLVTRVAQDLGIVDRTSWSLDERNAFTRLAPVIALIDDLAVWSPAERRALVRLMRAKGATAERGFAVCLRKHGRLRRELNEYCTAHEA